MHQSDTIAVSVVLSFSFVSIMLLTARFLWAHKSATETSESPNEYSADPQGQHFELSSVHRSWARMFRHKQEKGQWVPTLSGIIKAGDEGMYSSALIDNIPTAGSEVTLEMLYDSFTQELKSRPARERAAYSPALVKFLAHTRHRMRHSQSVSMTKDARSDLEHRPQRNSIDLAERGLNRSRSRRTTPVLVSTLNSMASTESTGSQSTGQSWIEDLQQAQCFDGRNGITVTSAELAALSVILGAPLSTTGSRKTSDNAFSHQGKGAFGISISSALAGDGKYYISLKQFQRSISQLPARGSGHSILFAKHLASGSLPFSQDNYTVNSILITKDTFEALRSGSRLHLSRASVASKASRFLTSLPSSRSPSYHILTTSETSSSTPLLLHAISELPFTGGLVPLVSLPVMKTVQFVASAGLSPSRLLQRLEALVDKVHRHSPSLQLFGPLLEDSNVGLLFRERERLGRLATGSSAEEGLADKTARMHRYTTLLERLMALVPGMAQHEVLCAVREATKKEIERSYEEAVAAYRTSGRDQDDNFPFPVPPPSKRHSTMSTKSKRHSARMSSSTTPTSSLNATGPTTPKSTTSPRTSSTFPAQDLGKQVEQLLKSDLPFDVQSIAVVARLVLVAWTLSCQGVAWEDEEEGVRLDNMEGLTGKLVLY